MSSDDEELTLSIQSLRYITAKECLLPHCTEEPVLGSPSHLYEGTTSDSLFSQQQQPLFLMDQSASSMSMFTLNQRQTFTEIAFLDPSTCKVPMAEVSIGSQFLKRMYEDPTPIKTYTNYLRKESVNLYNECEAAMVMQLVQKENKSKAECDFILKAIRNLAVFQKNKEVLAVKQCSQQLFNSLKVEHFPARKTVFNYGEFGNMYYIVLSGEADLLIPSPEYAEEREQEESSETHLAHESGCQSKLQQSDSLTSFSKKTFITYQSRDQSSYNSNSSCSDDSSFNETQEEYLKRKYHSMNLIKTFKTGDAFGEIALMTKQRRTGTVVSRNGVNLMTLDKDSFDTIMGSYSESIIQGNVNFLRTYGFFRGMPDSKLMALLNLMKIVSYNNKNVVYTEGDQSRYLYFIREGEVSISQICTSDEPSNQMKATTANAIAEDGGEVTAMSSLRSIKTRKSINKRVPIVIKGSLSYFGEDEILRHIDSRTQHAVCSSESAQIFQLRKDILYNYTRGYSVVEKMKQEFKVKGEWNKQRKEVVMLTRQSTKQDIDKVGIQVTVKSNNNSKPPISPFSVSKENMGPARDMGGFSQALSQSLSSLNNNNNSSAKKRLSLMESKTSGEFTPSVSCFDVAMLKQSSCRQMQMLCKIENGMANENSTEFTTRNSNSVFNKITPDGKIGLRLNNNINNSGGSSSTHKRRPIPSENPSLNQTSIFSVASGSKQGDAKSTYQISSTGKQSSSNIKNDMAELRQTAMNEFGGCFSLNAFVAQVGETVQQKMQLLKKLQSNNWQSPNMIGELSDEFSQRNRPTQLRAFSRKSLTPFSRNDGGTTQRAHSGLSGKEFQQELLKQQRKLQSQQSLRRKQASGGAGTTIGAMNNNMSGTLNTPNSLDESVLTLSCVKSFTRDSFIPQAKLDGEQYKRLPEVKSTTNINQNLDPMINSHSVTSLRCIAPELVEKGVLMKQSSLVYINELDTLEEVHESNSPVKNRQLFKRTDKRRETEQILRSQRSQGYQIQHSDRLSFVSPPSRSALLNMSTNVNNNGDCETPYSNSSKGFFNRNQSSLKSKLEAKRAISRNSSSFYTSNENSFRISSMKSFSAFSTKSLPKPKYEPDALNSAAATITTSFFLSPTS